MIQRTEKRDLKKWRKSRRKKTNQRNRRLRFESLEDRQLLAAFVVNSTADGFDLVPGDGVCDDGTGTCTLRGAIQEANALAGADTIILPAGTYTLTLGGAGEDGAMTGDLDITDSLTILGADAATTIIDASALGDRVFHILIPASSVTFSELTITGGLATDGGSFFAAAGGGILSESFGSVTIADSVITNNTADGTGSFLDGIGGGIADLAGNLTITNTEISDNEARGDAGFAGKGGGIYASFSSTSLLIDSAISGNEAIGGDDPAVAGGVGEGGGIYSDGATWTLIGAITVDSNQAIGGNDLSGSGLGGNASGGGIYDTSGTWDLTLIPGSTISRNSATGGNGDTGGKAFGGGLFADFSTWMMENNTISENTALGGTGQSGAGGDASGGGVYGGTFTTFTGSYLTIAENDASGGAGSGIGTGSGGGFFSDDAIGSFVDLTGSIIGKNTASTLNPDVADTGGVGAGFLSVGYNLIGDVGTTIWIPGPGDLIGTSVAPIDPLLGPLQNNGGPTETHALLAGSPAIDAADPVSFPPFDQRGMARPVDGDGNAVAVADIGAVEVASAMGVAAIDIEMLTNSIEADLPTGPLLPVGSTAMFTYVVSNTGSLDLSNVVVNDSVLGIIPGPISGDMGVLGVLEVGEIWMYTASAPVVPGQYMNTGTVTADDPSFNPVTDMDDSHYFGVSKAPDRFEDNDSLGTATILGSPRAVTLNDLTIVDENGQPDVDFYKYTAADTGNVILNLHFVHDEGNLDLRVRDLNDNIIASSLSTTDNEQIIIPVVSQEVYFIEVFSPDGGVNCYDLELENFAAPVPSDLHLDPASDTGMMSNDGITADSTPQIAIQADLADFEAMFNMNPDPMPSGVIDSNGITGADVQVELVGLNTGHIDTGSATRIGSTRLWTYTPGAALPDDTYSISAATTITDGQGTPVTGRTQFAEPLWITIDTSEPDTSMPVLLTSSDTGMLGDDMVTNKMSPAFSGIAEENAKVFLFATPMGTVPNLDTANFVGQGVATGFATQPGMGRWEITAEPLADGAWDFFTVIVDAAGNSSYVGPEIPDVAEATPVKVVWIDTAVPNTPHLDLLTDSGTNDADNITNVNALQFRMIGNDTVDGNGNPFPNDVKYRLYWRPGDGQGEVLVYDSWQEFGDFTELGELTRTITQELNDPNGQPIPDGEHNFKLEIEDRAGNVSPDFLLPILIDTAAPEKSFGVRGDTTDGLHADSDSGVAGPGNEATLADRITNDLTPTFWGRAEANATVRAYAENSDGDLVFIGQTTAVPLDGNEEGDPDGENGYWEITSTINMNALGFDPIDGLRRVFITAEDVAGNFIEIDQDNPEEMPEMFLDIFLDTQGPQVDGVGITGATDYELFGIKPNASQGATPAIDSITVDVADLPARIVDWLYGALQEGDDDNPAENPGNYMLVGDANGIIAIADVIVTNPAPTDGNSATATIELQFDEFLPDDRYTLTVKDGIVDPAGNKLDGESNAAEPNGGPDFPSGDGQPGGDFVARFTVDSRPELATYAGLTVTADINGNFFWDPNNLDATNRDLAFEFGSTSDQRLAGKFDLGDNPGPVRFDVLASYGFDSAVGDFVLRIDDNLNGAFDVGETEVVLGVDGLAVAGNWDDNAGNGDEIAIFTGAFSSTHAANTWFFFDLAGTAIAPSAAGATSITSNISGNPVAGDFDGDGLDDLATYQNDKFFFDLADDGLGSTADPGGADAMIATLFAIGNGERPVAADMDLDGIDDIGLWIPNTETQDNEVAEWRFLISNDFRVEDEEVSEYARVDGTVNTLDHAFSPTPVGNDLQAFFGKPIALPLVGNFDPPVGNNEVPDDADFIVNSLEDSVDANPGDGLALDASGNTTLRAAIEEANALAGIQTIGFDIIGSGPHTIALQSALPTITEAVVIDGTTEPDFAGTPVIELDGSNAGATSGLVISSGGSGTTIRGLAVNRFQHHGIYIAGGGNNAIEGNFIGTDSTGSVAQGNARNGIVISSSDNNTIGGTAAGAGNVIAGQVSNGILIMRSSGNTLAGNFVGTNAASSTTIGNGKSGIIVSESTGTVIGGSEAGARNVISGNGRQGIWIVNGSTGVTVEGNHVGTSADGTTALGNARNGVVLDSSDNNTIGGTTSSAGNVIAGNNQNGVLLMGTSGTTIAGNFIGTNAAGSTTLGNAKSGIIVSDATGTAIGGSAAGERNVISGNGRQGIWLVNGSTGVTVEGNHIGTSVDGTTALGNARNGVYIVGADNNTIGGTVPGAGNVISGNADDGIRVVSATGNAIHQNSIFSNAQLGIDLNNDGTTANDAGDPDAGANNLQNSPEITSASLDGAGNIDISYSVSSLAANSAYDLTVEFFLADGAGEEGQTFLGSASYSDATNLETDTITIPAGVAVNSGDLVVATATDADGNTSEFSVSTAIGSGDPLLAYGGEAAVASSQVLTSADVDPLLDDAIAAWQAAGISDSQLARLEGLQVGIADLSGARLGEQIGNTITIDVNAAGYGWHTNTQASVEDRMDLLTVIYHEMGHALGLSDDYSDPDSDDIMNGWLKTGTRREPSADDLDSLFGNEEMLESLLV